MTVDYPRLERLVVANFQSLEKADVSLGPFTVIVGPSDSGKSAFLRALRAVTRNVNSTSYVRVGKTLFTAEVEFAGTRVSIERGKSQSTYRVITEEGEEVFTKAGRTVPVEVQQALGLPTPDVEMTFSSQIDPPFLLSETGSTVAKVLGDLTNVSRLHAASKEANRRRLEASREQKFRQDDARDCAERIRRDFGDLKENARRVREARSLMDRVQAGAREMEALQKSLETLSLLEVSEGTLQEALSEIPEPADIESRAEKAGALLGERHALLDAIDTLSSLSQQEDDCVRGMQALESAIETLDNDYNKVLKSAGTCPVCNQKVA